MHSTKVNYGIESWKLKGRINELFMKDSAELYDGAARHDINSKVRKYALQKLAAFCRTAETGNYKSTIIDACADDKAAEVRVFAMRMLENEPASIRALKSITLNTEEASVKERSAAITRLGELGDSTLAREVSLMDPSYLVRAAAAKQLNNTEDLLYLIYTEGRSVRIAAAEKLALIAKAKRA